MSPHKTKSASTKSPDTRTTVPRLHIIVDCISLAEDAFAGGAPAVQARIKKVHDAAVLAECQRIVAAAQTSKAMVIINDRADIALACGADGVHVGAEDLPVAAVRELVGPNLLVGATARDPATALRHQNDGASYLGVGPVYASNSKRNLPKPLSPAGLAEVVTTVDVPVIAIAGISASQIPELLDAGAHGVAVLGGVANAASATQATAELMGALGG
ncbi:MAG: thiamine phosphate synthase [Acidimicrobiia bacterium]|nr:thiamine phosphate synthase [Acidimicrobiia bacterium]